jgi:hypothetical protein
MTISIVDCGPYKTVKSSKIVSLKSDASGDQYKTSTFVNNTRLKRILMVYMYASMYVCMSERLCVNRDHLGFGLEPSIFSIQLIISA